LSTAPIIIRREGVAGRITLNRPEVLHALNTDMCLQMTQTLIDWRKDPQIKCVLIDHAPNTRGFCGGGDVLMLIDSLKGDGKDAIAFFTHEYRLNALMKSYAKPIIAMMDGVVMGGGVGISAHGSHRLITERTLFAMPEVGIGLFPDVGGAWLLAHLDGEIGTWLALTGHRLKGRDVLAAGIGTHFVESTQSADLISQIEKEGIAAFAKLETKADRFDHRQIDHCFGGDSVEEILSKLEADHSDWAQQQITHM